MMLFRSSFLRSRQPIPLHLIVSTFHTCVPLFKRRPIAVRKDASLSDVVKAINAVHEELAEMRDQQAEMRDQQAETNKQLTGFIGNYSKSTEEEIVEAVQHYLDVKDSEVNLGFKIYNEKLCIVCEMDGFIRTEAFCAVVEAKSTVRPQDLDQLDRACWEVRQRFDGPVHGFIGGPLFKDHVREEVLRRGFGLVEVSGDRYRVLCTSNEKAKSVAWHA
jgi:hypothetical protein